MRTRRLRRALLWTAIALGGIAGGLAVTLFFTTGRLSSFGAKPEGARLERMKRSSHFDGARFQNTAGVGADLQQESYVGLAREYFFGEQLRTPPGPLPIEEFVS